MVQPWSPGPMPLVSEKSNAPAVKSSSLRLPGAQRIGYKDGNCPILGILGYIRDITWNSSHLVDHIPILVGWCSMGTFNDPWKWNCNSNNSNHNMVIVIVCNTVVITIIIIVIIIIIVVIWTWNIIQLFIYQVRPSHNHGILWSSLLQLSGSLMPQAAEQGFVACPSCKEQACGNMAKDVRVWNWCIVLECWYIYITIYFEHDIYLYNVFMYIYICDFIYTYIYLCIFLSIYLPWCMYLSIYPVHLSCLSVYPVSCLCLSTYPPIYLFDMWYVKCDMWYIYNT